MRLANRMTCLVASMLLAAACGEGDVQDPIRVIDDADCREEARACASGFVCLRSAAGRWNCIPDDLANERGFGDATTHLDLGPREGAAPAQACAEDSDCTSGECGPGPGGYCVVPCVDSADCVRGTTCGRGPDGRRVCLVTCASDDQCRGGWRCVARAGDVNTCQPDCSEIGCPSGLECIDETGECVSLECQPRAELCNGADEDRTGRTGTDLATRPPRRCRP